MAEVLLGERDRQATHAAVDRRRELHLAGRAGRLGSPLANKYAEGYPGARHHGGCELVDVAERIAVRAGHGRSSAPTTPMCSHIRDHRPSWPAYAALLRPGDAVLAMGLPYGGHLTHGSPANFSGRWFDFVGYGVDAETGLIDYDQVRALARKHRPRAIVCGSISYPRHPDYALFRAIADESGACLIADAAHPMGLIAGGAAPSPVPYADVVCATTHKVLRGPRGGLILCGAGLAERIDRAVFPFTQGGAQMHTIAAKAVAFGEAARPAFVAYAHQVVDNARVLAVALAAEGFAITTGGTDTHLITADPAAARRRRPQLRGRLAAAGMVLDTCALPHGDARGIRLGTAARHHAGHGRGGDGRDRVAVHGRRCVRGERKLVKKFGILPEDFRRIRDRAAYLACNHLGYPVCAFTPCAATTASRMPDRSLRCGAEMASDICGAACA